jgi:hypothetical protein
MSQWDDPKFSSLVGKTMTDVRRIGDERIEFDCDDGKTFALLHHQDCCESVFIEDVCGDLSDLVGTPILVAEEAESNDLPEGVTPPEYRDDSETWTFYKIRTIKGSVDIRWYGSSNGYYSESVSFEDVTP